MAFERYFKRRLKQSVGPSSSKSQALNSEDCMIYEILSDSKKAVDESA